MKATRRGSGEIRILGKRESSWESMSGLRRAEERREAARFGRACPGNAGRRSPPARTGRVRSFGVGAPESGKGQPLGWVRPGRSRRRNRGRARGPFPKGPIGRLPGVVPGPGDNDGRGALKEGDEPRFTPRQSAGRSRPLLLPRPGHRAADAAHLAIERLGDRRREGHRSRMGRDHAPPGENLDNIPLHPGAEDTQGHNKGKAESRNQAGPLEPKGASPRKRRVGRNGDSGADREVD